MYNPTLRLLAILELLQSRAQITAPELAQLLEVEERSIRRYILMLRDMGIPIDSERGRYGGYALRPGFRLPPLMFNQEEIVAVMVGLLLMNEIRAVSPLSVQSALAKIGRVLPDELRQQAHALQQFFVADLPLTQPISSEWLLLLNFAAANKHCLSMHYVSATGAITQRTISPYGVILHGQTWYVPAYCHLRGEKRVFRLDRIQSMVKSELPYHEEALDAKAYVLRSLANMPGIYTFEILIHAPLATVAEVVPASLALLADRNGETHLCCYSDDAYWLARYLLGLELPFTVLQTTELKMALRQIAENVLASVQ